MMLGDQQGRCETTLTERFEIGRCSCGTYPGNLGPCETFEPGANSRCAYCDHGGPCHQVVLEAKGKLQ